MQPSSVLLDFRRKISLKYRINSPFKCFIFHSYMSVVFCLPQNTAPANLPAINDAYISDWKRCVASLRCLFEDCIITVFLWMVCVSAVATASFASCLTLDFYLKKFKFRLKHFIHFTSLVRVLFWYVFILMDGGMGVSFFLLLFGCVCLRLHSLAWVVEMLRFY